MQEGLGRVAWNLISAAALSMVFQGLVVPWVLAQTTPPAPELRTEHQIGHQITTGHRFRFGLTLLEAGYPREAAAVFSDILARNPDLDRVRLELARAWFLSKQWGRARTEFLSVLAGDLPEPVRDNVLRFLRAIDARRGIDWDADFALVRLGNTRNYERDTIFVNGLPFMLAGRDDDKTALGLRYSLSTEFTQDLPGLSTSATRTLGFGRLALSGEEGPGIRFDDMTLRVEAGTRLVWSRTSLALAPFMSRRFLAGSATEARRGLQARFGTRTRTGATYALSAGWQAIDHLHSDNRDGHIANLGVTGTWRLSPRTSLGTSLALAKREARSLADDHHRMRLTVFGAFDAGRGITLSPRFHLERQTVDRAGPAAADETGISASLTVESNRIILGNGFTPYVTLSFSQTNSNIAAFSYRDHAASLGLERRF